MKLIEREIEFEPYGTYCIWENHSQPIRQLLLPWPPKIWACITSNYGTYRNWMHEHFRFNRPAVRHGQRRRAKRRRALNFDSAPKTRWWNTALLPPNLRQPFSFIFLVDERVSIRIDRPKCHTQILQAAKSLDMTSRKLRRRSFTD